MVNTSSKDDKSYVKGRRVPHRPSGRGKPSGGRGYDDRTLPSQTIPMNQQTENTENMNKQAQAISHDVERLAHDTSALLVATADVAGEKVGEARKRLASVLDRGKDFYGLVREKAVESSRAADVAVHENLYQTIAIGIGAGALIGYLFARHCSCNRG